jgi:hypothetical protein
MGLNRIAKFKGSKQDSLNLGARKPKDLNRIDKSGSKKTKEPRED